MGTPADASCVPGLCLEERSHGNAPKRAECGDLGRWPGCKDRQENAKSLLKVTQIREKAENRSKSSQGFNPEQHSPSIQFPPTPKNKHPAEDTSRAPVPNGAQQLFQFLQLITRLLGVAFSNQIPPIESIGHFFPAHWFRYNCQELLLSQAASPTKMQTDGALPGLKIATFG